MKATSNMSPALRRPLIPVNTTLISLLIAASGWADVRVFIVAGDSHAGAFGANADDLPAELQAEQTDVLFWYDIAATSENFDLARDRHLRPLEGTNTWVPLQPQSEYSRRLAFDKIGFGFTEVNITTGHGPEITLSNQLKKSLSGEIAILKFAAGAARIGVHSTSDWNVGSEDEMFDWMVEEVSTALTTLDTVEGKSGHVAGIFWAQDTDVFSRRLANEYEQNLSDLKNAIRNEWGSELPFIMLKHHEDIVESTAFCCTNEERLATTRMAQANVASQDAFTALVDMDDVTLGADSLHFDSAGTQIMGQRFAEAYLAMVPKPLSLQAGDADQDFDFDQRDLVQVQIVAKYLTGEVTTWGEGDWNGAPGGSPGEPPMGDGLFNQFDIIAAQQAATYLTGPYAAIQPGGQSGDAQTSLIYNVSSGELSVDAPAGLELTSINIDSAAGIFTGQAAENLGGSFDNDTDANIFKATFGSSFGSLSFGNVAQVGLSAEFVLADLSVIGSLAGGGELGNVDLVYVPEPESVLLLSVGLAVGLLHFRRVKASDQ